MRYAIGLLLLLSLPGFASQVMPAAGVAPHVQLGNLWEGGLPWQWNAPLAADQRPGEMATPFAKLHLGTGTDLFMITNGSFQATSYWVRYTLDPSSYMDFQNNGYSPISHYPISGELWVSFTREASGFGLSMHSDRLVGLSCCVTFYPTELSTAYLPPGQSGVQSITDLLGHIFPSDRFQSSLNLSFLELNWTGSGYALATSGTGFDTVFQAEDFEADTAVISAFHIAPVPLPAASLLFASAIGLLGWRRAGRG